MLKQYPFFRKKLCVSRNRIPGTSPAAIEFSLPIEEEEQTMERGGKVKSPIWIGTLP